MNKMETTNKKNKKSSVAKNPHRSSFPQFPKLPTELRTIIWNLTLQGRTVEIQFEMTRGFYSRVKTPVALRVCKDSRDAVLSSYSTCFGNLMFTPRTLFNFSFDTLYIGAGIDIQQQLMHLIGSMNSTEISKLQSLAIDNDINTDWEVGADAEFDYEACVKKAASLMPNLRVFLQVFDLAGWLLEDDIGEGIGAMELYLEWPTEVEDMHIWFAVLVEGVEGIMVMVMVMAMALIAMGPSTTTTRMTRTSSIATGITCRMILK
ncbi:hypothetical protein LHYA1_G009172 [Lachnellula hyalina]|uniref:2EXR domain-containing protein n=1 Tax=Lachnellula hyalina TaxID=1316788 RepID=A0A8H8QT84_9HELO|nr:uncharacterized protein LHYA1_G009172 [Lachnellula hyalina]TVY22233.1 hypothetical protein LHYA1_G009172 [Lachnellula hyalina]